MAITTTVTSDIETDRASGQTEAAPCCDGCGCINGEPTAEELLERVKQILGL